MKENEGRRLEMSGAAKTKEFEVMKTKLEKPVCV